MIVRTYTNMWNEEKKLYTIYDITLPAPVSFKQIGLFFMAAILWMPIMFFLNVPITNWMGAVAWFSVPVALAWFGNQKLFEGKSIMEYLQSVVTFAIEPKRILDGDGISEAAERFEDPSGKKERPTFELKYTAWSRKPLERI